MVTFVFFLEFTNAYHLIVFNLTEITELSNIGHEMTITHTDLMLKLEVVPGIPELIFYL